MGDQGRAARPAARPVARRYGRDAHRTPFVSGCWSRAGRDALRCIMELTLPSKREDSTHEPSRLPFPPHVPGGKRRARRHGRARPVRLLDRRHGHGRTERRVERGRARERLLREHRHLHGRRSGSHGRSAGRPRREDRLRRIVVRRAALQRHRPERGGPPGQIRAAGPHRGPHPFGIARLLRLQPHRPPHCRRRAGRHQGIRRRPPREGHISRLRLHGQPLPRRRA